jgi:histidinol phosphatase-like enzyme
VKKGSPYVFVIGDKVYDIENQKDARISAELEKHAGHAVEVKGSMSKDGKSVKISSIKMPETK